MVGVKESVEVMFSFSQSAQQKANKRQHTNDDDGRGEMLKKLRGNLKGTISMERREGEGTLPRCNLC